MSEETGDTRSTRQARRPNYLSGFLVLLTIGSLAFAYAQWRARQRLEVAVENRYTQAFFELVSNVDNVQVALAKSLATGSPRLRVGALSDVWKQAGDAQAG